MVLILICRPGHVRNGRQGRVQQQAISLIHGSAAMLHRNRMIAVHAFYRNAEYGRSGRSGAGTGEDYDSNEMHDLSLTEIKSSARKKLLLCIHVTKADRILDALCKALQQIQQIATRVWEEGKLHV